MIYKVHSSLLYYNDNLGIVNDYYQSIVTLIKNILNNNLQLKVNILLCSKYNFNNNNKTIIININYEHTLVKRYARDTCNSPEGNIFTEFNEKYLVRINNYDNLFNSHIIIDYSNPNIYNVRSYLKYEEFSKKHIYISSSIYDNTYFIKDNRNITSLTTFMNINEPRRKELLNNMNNHININNCFEKNELQNIYKNTKILLNIHQTTFHDTFEELRVLPAIECGVIVICENSPLIDTIPYKDLIIWTSYDNMIIKTTEIINNYDFFYNKIFTKENIDIICSLKEKNYNMLENIIINNSNP